MTLRRALAAAMLDAISIRFEPSEGPPRDKIKRWVMESYRVQAPKRLLRELEAAQPWVAAGALAALIGEPEASCTARMRTSTARTSGRTSSARMNERPLCSGSCSSAPAARCRLSTLSCPRTVDLIAL